MATSVLLKPQELSLFRNSDLEAQWVTSKEPNRAAVYLDSQDYKLEENPVDLIASTSNFLGSYPSILASGITRISIDGAGLNFVTPNVNIRNNNIIFFSSVTSTFYSIIVPEQFYLTATDLITAIVAAMNTVAGSSGLTFSFTTIPGFLAKFNLNSAGGNYYILNTSNAITRGLQLWALPTEQIPSNSKIVGNIKLLYTTYIDFCSQTLLKYVKLKTTTTNLSNNVIFRIHLVEILENSILFLTRTRAPNVQYYFKPEEPITQIDIQIRDQFGDLLYVPQSPNGGFQGFFWNLSLSIET